MKRLDIKVTDSINEVLEDLKKRTERSKTELVHDAIGLLWLTEKAYAEGHVIGEINPETGSVISRFVMPMFEGTRLNRRSDQAEGVAPSEAPHPGLPGQGLSQPGLKGLTAQTHTRLSTRSD